MRSGIGPRLLSIAKLGTDAGKKAALLVAEGLQALALNLFKKFVHAAFVSLALLQVALHLHGTAALQPALQKRLPAPLSRRGLIALEACITLGEIVTEDRVLAAVLQHDELLPAGHIDEQGQHEEKDAVVGVDQSIDGEQQRKNEAEVNGNDGCLAIAEPRPQDALQQPAGIER